MQPQSSESGSIHLSLVLIGREESVEFEIKVDIRAWCHRERRVSFSSQSRIKVLKSLSLGRKAGAEAFLQFLNTANGGGRRELSSYQITRPPRHLSQKVRSGLLSANAGDIQTQCSHRPMCCDQWPTPAPGAPERGSVTGNSGPGQAQDPVKGSEQYGNRP